MTTPVNLNRFRKAQQKAEAKKIADQNAVKHGRTKAERVAEAARDTKLARHLDQHRFDE